MKLPRDIEADILARGTVGPGVKLPLPDPPTFRTEKEFQAAVVAFAKAHGWELIYHTLNSRGSASGFPDLILIRWNGGLGKLVVAELKVGDNQCSPSQGAWIAGFLACNVATFVWRPDDWPQIESVLGDPHA